MGLVVFAIVGLVVGLLVAAGMPHAAGGPVATATIGLTGALVGGIAGALLTGMDPLTQLWSLMSLIGAVAGAIVVLALYALIASPGGLGPGPGESTGSGDATTGSGR